MYQTTTAESPCVSFLTNMTKTQLKVVAILTSLIASIITSFQLNTAMLNSHTKYIKKRMNIVRLLLLPSSQNAIVKRLAKMRQRKSAFRFDQREQELGRMALLVHVFAGLSLLQLIIRSCFMSVFKSTRVRVDGRK